MRKQQANKQQRSAALLQRTPHISIKGTKMSFIIVSLLALLVSISAFSARSSDAKPLSQNQVKFRRLPPREFSALIGSSITIECEASSSPPPTIHWLKNGKRIPQTVGQFDENLLDDLSQQQQQQQRSSAPLDDINRIALSSTRSRLFIDCSDTHDEATYTCVAENTYSRVASNTKLTIMRPLLVEAAATGPISDNNLGEVGSELGAQVADLQQQQQQEANLSAMAQCLRERNSNAPGPARIHMWTHNIIEIMKNDVILYCRSNVNSRRQPQPEVAQAERTLADLLSKKLAAQQRQQQPQLEQSSSSKVSWTLPDDKSTIVSPEHRDKFELLETGDLLIKDLRWEDMGSYVCTVSNELGSDSVSTFVYPASVKPVKSKRATQQQQQQQAS